MEPRLCFDQLPSTPINRVVDMQILTHLLQFFTNIIDQDKKKTLIISIEYPHSCHELTCPHCGAQLKRHGIYTRHPGVKEFNLRVLRTIIPNIPDSVTDFKILIPRLYCDNKDCPIVSKNKCKIATFGLVLLKIFIPFKQHLTKLLDVMQDYYQTKEVSETSPKDSEEQIKSKNHLVELNKQYSLLDDEDDKAEDNDFFEEFFETAHKNMIKNLVTGVKEKADFFYNKSMPLFHFLSPDQSSEPPKYETCPSLLDEYPFFTQSYDLLQNFVPKLPTHLLVLVNKTYWKIGTSTVSVSENGDQINDSG